MTLAKRCLDIFCSLGLILLLALPFGMFLLWLRAREGGPIFHVSERMRGVDRPFKLWKLRTMTVVSEAQNAGVSGGDKVGRVTPMGRKLRRYRLDEIPQLWNVLKGDMSFVGPRPPLRLYVERFPEIYREVLKSRPGITGLASLYFHRHEEYLLRQCTTPEETDHVYSTRCVPRKAYLDLLYQRQRNICLDMKLMYETLARVMLRRK